MKNTRQLAYHIVYEVLFKNAYSNIQINKYLNTNEISRTDKAFITEIVYGSIEKKLYLEHILKKYINISFNKISPEVYTILIISIYQIVFMDKVKKFAVVDEAVKLCKKINFYSSKFVNAVLRNLLRDEKYFEIVVKDNIEYLTIKYSISKDIVNLLKSQYLDYERILEKLNEKADIFIRTNVLKTNVVEFYDLLKNDYDCEIFGDYSIKVKKLNNIGNNEYFKKGYFTIQDLSSTKAIEMFDPKENEVVLDLCSAPGGKTTFIAELMRNKGKILACDISKNKLPMIENSAKRLGIEIIETREMNAEIFDKDLENRFDKVIADVPCSGLGIIRRKPEIRYKTYEEIQSLYDTQKNILNNAGRYTKKGGILMYSTCSINKEENEEQVKVFLKENKFNLIEEKTFLFNENESDGFYIAKMQKME